MKKLAVDTLMFQYKAQKKHAEHTLENYLNNPIAVGEHPDLIKEMDTALQKWEDANGKLETLLRLTGDGSGIG